MGVASSTTGFLESGGGYRDVRVVSSTTSLRESGGGYGEVGRDTSSKTGHRESGGGALKGGHAHPSIRYIVSGGGYDEAEVMDDDIKLQQVKAYIREFITAFEVEGEWLDEDRLDAIVADAHKLGNEMCGMAQAIEWADNFKFPPEVRARDAEEFERCGYNFVLMAGIRQEARRHNSLSEERVRELIPEGDPDFGRMLELAGGVRIDTDTDFVHAKEPLKIRNKYRKVATAVHKLIYSSYLEGHVIILPTEQVSLHIEDRHFSAIHWTVNKDKDPGRMLTDTGSAETGSPLNSEEAKRLAEERWGPITHPTLKDLMGMVTEAAEKYGWEDIVIWKMDIKGAFTLLNFHPESTPLMCFELLEGLTMVCLAGTFGWTGMPFAFHPVTRVVRRNLRLVIRGFLEMYVDDLMGVCHKDDRHHDMGKAKEFIEGLMGTGSVAEHKSLWGRQLDMIGWDVNLDIRKVSIAAHNFRKLLYGLFSVDLDATLPIPLIEKFASWASRYTAICRFMAPFTGDLYGEIAGMRNRHASKILSPAAKECLLMWRMFACILRLDPTNYARDITSFNRSTSQYLLEYDASLSGIGIIIYALDTRAQWVEHIVSRADFPFDLGQDSSFQNTVEFTAIVMGFALLANSGVVGAQIDLLGDNTTSLAWANKEQFKEGRSRRAAMVFMGLSMAFDCSIGSAQHWAGELHTRCDSMSRGMEPADLGFDSGVVVPIRGNRALEGLLTFCNPTVRMEGHSDIMKHYANITHHVTNIRFKQ